MLGIAPGEAALDAAMPAIGLAFLPRHHAHQFLAPHLRAEGAADAAIGAGGDDGAVGRAGLHHLLLDQAGGGAGLNTGPTGHAFGREEVLPLRGGHPGRSEEHTSELQSLMRISYAVFCLKKKKINTISKQYYTI